jgi:hypothetical protein
MEEAQVDFTNEQFRRLYSLLQEPYSYLFIDTVTNEKILTLPLRDIEQKINESTFKILSCFLLK